MRILLNGREEVLPGEMALTDFLIHKGLEQDRIVVEYNCQVVKQEDWANIWLKENDRLEVLRFVGGG